MSKVYVVVGEDGVVEEMTDPRAELMARHGVDTAQAVGARLIDDSVCFMGYLIAGKQYNVWSYDDPGGTS